MQTAAARGPHTVILPVKADFTLPRFPIFTVLVCLICLGVFLKQQSDWHDFDMAITKFCNAERSHIDDIIFKRLGARGDIESCVQLMYSITEDPEKSEAEMIEEMVGPMKPLTGYNLENSRIYVTMFLEEEVDRYHRDVPGDPDEGLAYYTGSWNPITMLTSSFAHGDWFHIIFNLVIFFAFAATVEVLVGPIWYIAFVVVDSLFIGLTGSIFAAAAGMHYSTLGLSGVVMGMMGLFAYLLPKAKIRCFYFFIIFFGFVSIPGWALALFYIGGDIFRLMAYDDHGVVNVMAHVMGGIGGYLFGVALLGDIKKDTAHVQDDLDMQEREARFRG